MLEITKEKIPATVALEMLALESENSSNILNSAVKLLPNILSELTTSGNSLLELSKTFKFADLKAALVNRFSNQDVPEDALKKLFVPVPEGFNGNVLKYQSALVDSLEYIEAVTMVQLKEFYVTAAAFVTNRDRKLSIKDDSGKFKNFEKQRATIVDDISTHFTKGNTGRTVFNDAYLNYQEFKKAYSLNRDLVKRSEGINIKTVHDQVKKIVETLDIAIKAAERSEYDKASNEALMNLSTGTYELAQQVEFLAVTLYRIQSLTFAIAETDSKIKKL